MKTKINWILIILFQELLFPDVHQEQNMSEGLKHELASGVRYDSLFLAYTLECLKRFSMCIAGILTIKDY